MVGERAGNWTNLCLGNDDDRARRIAARIAGPPPPTKSALVNISFGEWECVVQQSENKTHTTTLSFRPSLIPPLHQPAMESRLLRSHRVIGAVAHVDSPRLASFYSLGGEGFVCARVCQDAFHVMKLDGLTVQMTSPRLGRRIEALVCVGEWTLVSFGTKELRVFLRCQDVGFSEAQKPIESLLAVGESVVGLCGGDSIAVWTLSKKTKQSPLRRVTDFEVGAQLTTAAHPPTYVNKLLVGKKDKLQLWNMRSKKKVHEYACCANEEIASIEPSGVLDVVAVGFAKNKCAALIDARSDQTLFVLECGVTPTCMVFAAATAASRNGGDKKALLLTGGSDGVLRVWDLEERRLAHEELGAHRAGGAVRGFAGGWNGTSAVASLGPSSIAVTTVGGDNSIAQWTFEATDGSCRLARRRQGHAAPPTLARWYGPPACGGALSGATIADPYGALQLLTCSYGDRSVRVAHAARDALNTEMSQGSLLKRAKTLRLRDIEELRLPPVVAIAACDAKDGSWANVVTCHEGQAPARCWHFARRVIADVALSQPQWTTSSATLSATSSSTDKRATSCALSPCGNFAIIGHVDGRCRKYNVQSGRPRGEYPANLEAAAFVARKTASVAVPGSITRARREIERKLHKGEKLNAALDASSKRRVAGAEGISAHRRGQARLHRHKGAVTGIIVDAENAYLATAGLDGMIKWWNFRTHALVAVVDCGSAVSRFEGARAAGLLAAACDDGVVRVYDAKPPSIASSPRRRRKKVLPTKSARLVRRFRCGDKRSPRDIAWAPDFKTFYAACGDGSLRVWDVSTGALVDWLEFRTEATAVAVSPTGEFVATAHVGERGVALWTDKASYCRVDLRPLTENDSPIQIDNPNFVAEPVPDVPESILAPRPAGLAAHVVQANVRSLRLSGKSRARLEALHALEAIAERNKPVEPPKKPESAPFFLPSSLSNDAPPLAAVDDPKPEVEDKEEEPATKRRRKASFEAGHRCQLATLTLSSKHEPIVNYLASLEPSAVDAEIALLCQGEHDDPGVALLDAFLGHLLVHLKSRDHLDEVQAYLHRVFQHHSAALARPEVEANINALHKAQCDASSHIRNLFHEALCLADFLSGPNA